MRGQPERLRQQVCGVVSRSESPDTTDAALLQRFVRARDQDAFAALVARHGALVLGVCRRVLGDAADSEDAFQATFLVLARKAASIRVPESLAAWLHGTARRMALRCARSEVRRRARETRSVEHRRDPGRPDLLDEISARELLVILDQELQRLPESKRLPVILCVLEGHTQEDAARLLGISPGTMKGRLERGRARLQARLARRGLTVPAVFLALEVSRGMAGAEVPAVLLGATVKASVGFAAATVTPAASTTAVSLAEQALRALLWAKIKLTLACMLVFGVVMTATGLWLLPAPETAPAPAAIGIDGLDVVDVLDPLPPRGVARLGTLRFRHGSVVTCVAVTSDGKVVASGGWDQAVRLWDAETGQALGVFGEHRAKIQAVALSPDGRLVASLADDLRVWDRAECRQIWSFTEVSRGTAALAFTPDGELLAIPGAMNEIRLFEARTGTERRRLAEAAASIQALAVAHDGKTLVSGSDDGQIRIWDVARGELLQSRHGHAEGVTALAFTPDDATLVSGGLDGVIRLWDATSGSQRREIPAHEGAVRTLHCSPDGKLLASGNGWPAAKRDVSLWHLATGQPAGQLLGGFQASCRFAADGATLFYGRGDAFVHRYDLARHAEVASGFATVRGIAFSADGNWLAFGGDYLRLCAAASGKIVRTMAGHPSGIYSVAFSPDSTLIASAGRDATIRLWDVRSGTERIRLEGHKNQPSQQGWINAIAFSPDGKLLAETARDGTALVWDVASAREVRRLTVGAGGAGGFAYDLAFSPDGTSLALAGPGSTITIFDGLLTRSRIRRLEGHTGTVEGIAYSPDGTLLASAALDGTIRLWHAATGQQARQFQEPAGWTVRQQHHRDGRSIRFSPDGKSVACGSWQSALVWDVASGQERHRLDGHLGEVAGIAFSPDGRRLATSSFDTTVMVWDVTGP